MIININNCNPRTQKQADPYKVLPAVEPLERSEHDVPDSWKYLNKATKDAITMVDVQGMMRVLQAGGFASFYNTYSTLVRLHNDGWRMSEDQMQVMALPQQMWGDKAEAVLTEMRWVFLEEKERDPTKKRRRKIR